MADGEQQRHRKGGGDQPAGNKPAAALQGPWLAAPGSAMSKMSYAQNHHPPRRLGEALENQFRGSVAQVPDWILAHQSVVAGGASSSLDGFSHQVIQRSGAGGGTTQQWGNQAQSGTCGRYGSPDPGAG